MSFDHQDIDFGGGTFPNPDRQGRSSYGQVFHG